MKKNIFFPDMFGCFYRALINSKKEVKRKKRSPLKKKCARVKPSSCSARAIPRNLSPSCGPRCASFAPPAGPPGPGHANVRGPDTLWTVRARIDLAVARAVFRSHRQEEDPSVDSASVDSASVDALSPFAAALVSALRDMKLCRLVVDRLAFSPLSLCSTPRQASRSLSLLVTVPAER